MSLSVPPDRVACEADQLFSGVLQWLRRFHDYRIFRRSPLSPAAVFHRTREFCQQLVLESVNETMVDMFMMAACAGPVYSESAYNLCAQHMTMCFNGNCRRFEQYFEHPIKRLARSLRDVVRTT